MSIHLPSPTEAILERDSTLHTKHAPSLTSFGQWNGVVILCCCGPLPSYWRSAGGQRLRSKSPTWPSPLSSQALGLHQLNVLCQSAYKAHVTFAVLLDLDILLTPFDDDFIVLARLPVLLFNLSLHLELFLLRFQSSYLGLNAALISAVVPFFLTVRKDQGQRTAVHRVRLADFLYQLAVADRL